ncbi:MAG: FAD-binding domain-containing protein [Gammaproteobacteria bacterium]
MQDFIPRRINGLENLERFVARAGRDYERTRNFDFGASNRSNVSGLSPWLRHRLISEEEVLERVLAVHSLSAAEKFVQEVCWRTYWKGWLEQRPQVWRSYREQAGAVELDRTTQTQLNNAHSGTTGIRCFDHWCDELVSTGYLHNHARMWFASIWIFTLRLPWFLGADFFMRNLVDGDAASNTLSWRWVAGLQTVGKTYLAREDNIAKFTDGRFPRTPDLVHEALPVTETKVLAPQMPTVQLPKKVPGARLITDDDLMPHDFGPDVELIDDALILDSAASRSPNDVGEVVKAFVAGALEDAQDRLGPAQIVRCSEDYEQVAQTIAGWCREHDVKQLVSSYVPVGPSQDVLLHLTPFLQEHDIVLSQVMREWDSDAWPFATKGFFNFKKNIPALLERRGVT